MKDNKREFILSKQLLRSVTSIGAMVREAELSESKLDFIHKFAIVQKEANEVLFLLELLEATSFINKDQFEDIYRDADEIIRLITSILKPRKLI